MGLEPTTYRLTAGYSAIELPWNEVERKVYFIIRMLSTRNFFESAPTYIRMVAVITGRTSVPHTLILGHPTYNTSDAFITRPMNYGSRFIVLYTTKGHCKVKVPHDIHRGVTDLFGTYSY